MDTERFVTSRKKSIQHSSVEEVSFLLETPTGSTPRHIRDFSAFIRSLSPESLAVLRDLVQYRAEGCLFELLTYLDNLCLLTEDAGRFELYFSRTDGTKVLLNREDDIPMSEVFNSVD